jgi:hypothetical protein
MTLWSERVAAEQLEVARALRQQFPQLYGEPPDGCDISIGKGWLPIVVELSEAIIAAKLPVSATCVKEKLGALRWYWCWAVERPPLRTNEMLDLVQRAEARSFKTCEDCGQPGCIRAVRRHSDAKAWGLLRCLCGACIAGAPYIEKINDDDPLAASSLGAAEVQALAALTPPAVVESILRRAAELTEQQQREAAIRADERAATIAECVGAALGGVDYPGLHAERVAAQWDVAQRLEALRVKRDPRTVDYMPQQLVMEMRMKLIRALHPGCEAGCEDTPPGVPNTLWDLVNRACAIIAGGRGDKRAPQGSP